VQKGDSSRRADQGSGPGEKTGAGARPVLESLAASLRETVHRAGQPHLIPMPPSEWTTVPVIPRARSEARNT